MQRRLPVRRRPAVPPRACSAPRESRRRSPERRARRAPGRSETSGRRRGGAPANRPRCCRSAHPPGGRLSGPRSAWARLPVRRRPRGPRPRTTRRRRRSIRRRRPRRSPCRCPAPASSARDRVCPDRAASRAGRRHARGARPSAPPTIRSPPAPRRSGRRRRQDWRRRSGSARSWRAKTPSARKSWPASRAPSRRTPLPRRDCRLTPRRRPRAGSGG